MKNFILTLMVLISTCVLQAQVNKTDLKGKVGISLYGGVNIPAKGDISPTVKTTDLLNSGPHFGLSVSYFFTNAIGVEAAAGYYANIYNDKYKLNGKQPAVSVTSFSLNGIYNFGHLFSNNRISPYVKAGVGSYEWRYLDDAPWREGEVVSVNGVEQKSSSFGFNVGLGADYSINRHFSVGVLLDYNMYFPKDEEKFGNDFSSQGNFTPQLKLTYYLPTH